MIRYYKTKGLFWFRIFEKGLLIKNVDLHPLLFSQRNNITKGVTFCKWYIEILR